MREKTSARHELVRLKGGALAVRSLVDGEVMHPGVGPQREAQELYVAQSRLAERLVAAAPRPLVLFDVGLGAGTNALAARAVSEACTTEGAQLQIVSFERDLDALDLALQHAGELGIDDDARVAATALLRGGRHTTHHTDWQLRLAELREALAREPARADLIFWDPFSPRANPTLWSVAAFALLLRCAAPRCLLVTYSGSTRVRLALLLAGWCVGIGAAIGDKAQTTVAALDAADLERPLDGAWLKKRADPTTPWPDDAPPDALATLARHPQFAAASRSDAR